MSVTRANVGPHGFIRETKEESALFVAKMALPVTDAEHLETIAVTERILRKRRPHPDYCNNLIFLVGMKTTGKGETATQVMEVYAATPPASGSTAEAVRYPGRSFVGPPARDGRFTMLQQCGHYLTGKPKYQAKLPHQAKIKVSIEARKDECDIPAEIAAEASTFLQNLFHTHYETFFDFIEKYDERTQSDPTQRRTKESLRAIYDRKGGPDEGKQTQYIVRNGNDPESNFPTVGVSFGAAELVTLGTASKRRKGAAIETREDQIKDVENSWADTDADPWFNGYERADGTVGPEQELMREFKQASLEKLRATRDGVDVCKFADVPVVGQNNIEYSFDSRLAIQKNAGSNLIMMELTLPSIPSMCPTNLGIYAKTVFHLGRVKDSHASGDSHRTDLM